MPDSHGTTVDRLSRKQRLERGQKTRKHLSRKALGVFDPKKRGFNPVDVLINSTSNRLPELLPLKYGRMAASPFAFFRGAVSIMAADLGRKEHTGLLVQLCGDAHLQNLGSFEAPDGRVVFDINDFDETIEGPWEWDVKRMAASIVLAGQESNHSDSKCAIAVEDFLGTYLNTLETLADQPILVAARHQIRRLRRAQAVSEALLQAERAQPLELLKKYTEKSSGGSPRFRDLKPVLWRLNGEKRTEALTALNSYKQSLSSLSLHLFNFFEAHDVAFKVVGTGSVGLRDYVVLMQGSGKDDPLFLQIKQEVASAYYPYLKSGPATHEGRRVVEGQRKIQPISDLLLGWTRIGGHDFLVRQLNDHKGTIDMDNLRGTGLNTLVEVAGALLARGHARSGDALAIKGYIGNPDRVIKSVVQFALRYAQAVEADFEAFQKEIKANRLKIVKTVS
jgi:uncharacterized protein (DUF2252 family)